MSHSSREASPPIQTPSSSSAEAHNGRALRQFDTNDDREDSFDRDSEDYGRERYNPANMASWSGTPSIKGNTEAVRMVLLNFITIGVTYVSFCHDTTYRVRVTNSYRLFQLHMGR